MELHERYYKAGIMFCGRINGERSSQVDPTIFRQRSFNIK